MPVLSPDKFAKLKAAQEGFYVIGLQDVTGATGTRRDIDDLALNEKEAFNIFIIALTNMQAITPANTQNPMSYFQLSGIHGLPLRPWNKEGVKLNVSGRNKSGYCHHSHIGFGPWHRPYLALLEQSIFYNMIQVVEKDFQNETYFAAVRRWRLPYWDYYRPRGGPVTWRAVGLNDVTNSDFDCGIPDVFTFPMLMIRTSLNASPVPFINPLLKFKFPAESDGGLDQKDWGTEPGYDKNQTTRYPNTMKERSLNDAYNHLVTRSKNIAMPLDNQPQDLALNKFREQALKHLTVMFRDPSYVNMSAFGSNARTPGVHGSLEGTIHGTYHGLIGDSGHMGDVPVAAFDPVFWVHHCQIDRLFAIWQKINPNSWFPTDQATITQLSRDGVYFNPEDNLMPFRSATDGQVSTLGKNGWWTCNTSRYTNTFGYSYADIDVPNAQQNFNNKYGWSIRWNKGDAFGKCPPDMLPFDMTKAQIFQFSQSDLNQAKPGIVKAAVHAAQSITHSSFITEASLARPAAAMAPAVSMPQAVLKENVVPAARTISTPTAQGAHAAPDAEINEAAVSRSWYIDMEVARHALNGSFFINFFTGPFGTDPNHYNLEPELAGTTNVFAAPAEACDNCGLGQEVEVTDTTDITPILLDYINVGQLHSLGANEVIAFLKTRLKWRVVTAKNQIVDPRTIASLKLGISSRIAPLPPNTGDIRYQDFPGVIEAIIANSASY